MKCSLLALLSCRFGVLFSSLAVACLLCRDIVKKECALAWRMTCARFPPPACGHCGGRAASAFQAFQRPVIPLFRLYAVLRLTLCRIAAVALFLCLFPYSLTLAGFLCYSIHGKLLCGVWFVGSCILPFWSSLFDPLCHPSVAPRHCEKRMRAGRA